MVKFSVYLNRHVFVMPAGTQHQNDVVSTSVRRDHVASTLIRRHFNVVCLLGEALQEQFDLGLHDKILDLSYFMAY